jgi:conjugal transfer/entry exclusion protein
MDGTIEQISLTFANQLLATVLDGLDVITLRNPSRRQHLQLAINCIAPSFASTSRIRDMLNRLIAISEELERVYTEFEENSKCKAQAVEATTLELATNKEALQATAREKAAIEQQQDEILAEIAKLNDVLQGVKQKMEQVSEVWSTQNLEVQRLDRELNDVAAEASQKAAEDLHGKTADLGEEAERIFADLKNVNTNSG